MKPAALLRALRNLAAGLALGAILLEVILRANATALPRGVPSVRPVDPPLTAREYEVRYLDADAFLWRPDLVRPPVENRVEAHILFQTDEFGFRNSPGLPMQVFAVVLGRSFSLGAQVPAPWPHLLQSGLRQPVLNLAQPGPSLGDRLRILSVYGLPRSPRWVLLDVMPALDLLSGQPAARPRVSYLPVAFLQPLLARLAPPAGDSQPVFPLRLDLAGVERSVTCCIHYTELYTLTAEKLAASAEWREFTAAVTSIRSLAAAHGACLALVFVPQKPNIYFSLADDPAQLAPIADLGFALDLDGEGRLAPVPGGRVDPAALQRNALAARDLLARFAAEKGLLWVDPSPLFLESASAGESPFMAYDSHWNALGHELAARAAARSLAQAPCP